MGLSPIGDFVWSRLRKKIEDLVFFFFFFLLRTSGGGGGCLCCVGCGLLCLATKKL